MKLFAGMRANKELKSILHELRQYLSNNYKEPAHRAKDRLIARTEELYADGALSEKDYREWKSVCEEYVRKMADYHH
ncbi:MAG: hypothetical protein IJX47_03320 [Clostridia bacterium]|nr:hypothetical protein [Clostridia bacterium]MBQ8382216.1 hypothetical protein [Clostridia bacterium]